MLKCGIIGLGGLGKAHLRNVKLLEGAAELTAVCDVNEAAFDSVTAINMNINASAVDGAYRRYTDALAMLTEESLDFIISAVPTYLHREIAGLALDRGVHVLSEKPMALTLEDCRGMIGKAKAAGKQLMIGQCLRYWPEYRELKAMIESGRYGKVICAEFARLSALPRWSWQNWYWDWEKSGGALFDLHIHDVDMINWLFGKPEWVSAVASHTDVKFDSVAALYGYEGKFVSARAYWGLAASFPFEMSFLVRFENATVRMENAGLIIYTEDRIFKVETPQEDAYYSELADFVRCVAENRAIETNPPEDSMAAIEIATAEKESILGGKVVSLV
ncbi:MAG: Gfo/Idh/MocA family oxidoreductase [Clostridiales bacterium]|jgi:predicted dehydrogenase|nr:Gfo/Idh/MocA family oxidoreductase [Clostridiales bacterium]